ncbi:E3 ubiquitin-protein ligase NEURL1-like isoform X2 [Dreissena polymorpha]|uniref:E3 ubiquitin-protein ligase NEURL1-like isoform X2 n=1 Tax=Dreissena polymorpha TaxID=45954 RepID=UPI0022648D8B|nr:E3 ubiquitin-protein ligase NEURL1-like isoform X2 [Dreissena polymorpha]
MAWYIGLMSFVAYLSIQRGQAKQETFSENRGPKLELSSDRTEAWRYEGGCWAVGLGAERLSPGERLTFNITERECCWLASLNVGIIYRDPDNIPQGDLVICDENVTNALNDTKKFLEANSVDPDETLHDALLAKVFIFEQFYSPENIYTFWIDDAGVAYLTPNVTENDVVFDGVDVKKPFWPIFNIFGDTKAIKLMGKTIGDAIVY